jgi:hypothetical protein
MFVVFPLTQETYVSTSNIGCQPRPTRAHSRTHLGYARDGRDPGFHQQHLVVYLAQHPYEWLL